MQIVAADEDALYRKLYDIEYGEENYSMAEIFPLWLIWKRDHTPTTAKTLQIHQQKWRKYLEDTSISKVPLRKLTPRDFTRLFREWTKGRALTSKEFNNVKSIINGIFSYAINELAIVSRNPIREIDMRQFPLKPVNSKKEKAFNSEERAKLLNYMKNKEEQGIDEMYSLAIQFDFYVTLRIGELRALKWENLRENEVYVEGQVVLFNEHLKKYCEEAGIDPKGRGSHSIRFTVASILYLNGTPIQEIQRLLGHTSMAMTLHYLKDVQPRHKTAELMEKCL